MIDCSSCYRRSIYGSNNDRKCNHKAYRQDCGHKADSQTDCSADPILRNDQISTDTSCQHKHSQKYTDAIKCCSQNCEDQPQHATRDQHSRSVQSQKTACRHSNCKPEYKSGQRRPYPDYLQAQQTNQQSHRRRDRQSYYLCLCQDMSVPADFTDHSVQVNSTYCIK